MGHESRRWPGHRPGKSSNVGALLGNSAASAEEPVIDLKHQGAETIAVYFVGNVFRSGGTDLLPSPGRPPGTVGILVVQQLVAEHVVVFFHSAPPRWIMAWDS